jgi:glucokinase
MRDYSNDKRAVLTLDAGGTNFVFSAMQANRAVVESFALAAEAGDLERSLGNMFQGFERVLGKLDAAPSAISFQRDHRGAEESAGV